MKSLFGAISTAVGYGVHIASGTWLCRVCGKPIEIGSVPADSARCASYIRKGKR